MVRRAKALQPIAWAAVAFVVPTCVATNYTLNHFYVEGAFLLDSGWFAYLTTHAASWPLRNPPAIGGSWFSTHFSLIFYPLTALYRLLGSPTEAVYFSVVQASWFGLLGLSIALCFWPLLAGPLAPLAVVVAIAAAGNGVALAILGFPHVEIAIPAFGLLYLALYENGWRRSAWVALGLGLTIREDAGLHYFGVLVLLGAAEYLRHRDARRLGRRIVPAVVCLVWGVAAIGVQKACYPGDDALTRVYTGAPAYAHLTGAFLANRLRWVAAYRRYLVAPLALVLLAGVVTRDWLLLVGPLAVVPWCVLSVTGIAWQAGSLTSYYAFPLVFAVVWPAVRYAVCARSGRARPMRWLLLTLASAAVSIATFPGSEGNHDLTPWTHFGFDYFGHVARNEAAVDEIFARRPAFGRMQVDDAVAAIRPGAVHPGEWRYPLVLSDDELASLDTFVFHVRTRQHDRATVVLDHARLVNACVVQGTSFVVSSRRDIAMADCAPWTLPTNQPVPLDHPRFDFAVGWSHFERVGRWTVGPSVDIPPFASTAGERGRFCLTAVPFVPVAGRAVTARVVVDGIPSETWVFAGRDPVRRCVDVTRVADPASVHVVLELDGYSSPMQYRMSSDDRALGLFVSSMSLWAG